MKKAFLILVFLSSGSFLAHGDCQANQSLTVLRVHCACNQTDIFLNVCTMNFGGIGCDTSGQQQTCGGGCTYISGVGCNARGPKIFADPLAPQIGAIKTDKTAVLACSSDNRAFEKWLMETSSSRRTKPL